MRLTLPYAGGFSGRLDRSSSCLDFLPAADRLTGIFPNNSASNYF